MSTPQYINLPNEPTYGIIGKGRLALHLKKIFSNESDFIYALVITVYKFC